MDSGSSVSAWPPDPGDQVDHSAQLKAINGSRLKCHGFKTVDIKIGRKTYQHQVVKADLTSSLIGWDLVRKYKTWTAMTLFRHNAQAKCGVITLFPLMPLSGHQRVVLYGPI